MFGAPAVPTVNVPPAAPANAPVVAAQNAPVAAPQPSPKSKSEPGVWIFVAILVVLAVCAIALIGYFVVKK
jgi:hypothetical protein